MMEYERCKRALACKLVNVRSNMMYLRQVPFAPAFADMAVTACILTRNEYGDEYYLPVTNQVAEEWGMSVERLLDIAQRNMFRILTPKIYTMQELMLSDRGGSVYQRVIGMMAREYPDTPREALREVAWNLAEQICEKYEREKGTAQMWVLSNKDWIFGASGLLYPRVLEKFAGQHEGSFYIIPTSVHEVILLPESEYGAIDRLRDIHRTACEAAMARRRFLSDCFYYYDSNKLEIRCI